jgi:hypothetical protein
MQHLAALSRRNLLKTGLVGTVLVGLGSVGLALQKTRPRADTPALAVFDAREYAVLCAIADRIAPALGPGAPGALALGTVTKLDALLEQAELENQKSVKLALRVFENALTGAVLGERLVPFTELSIEARDRVLSAWRDSRIGFRRTVFHALASLILSVYWGDPRVWPRIGYGGPPDLTGLRSAYADNLVDLDALRAMRPKQEI